MTLGDLTAAAGHSDPLTVAAERARRRQVRSAVLWAVNAAVMFALTVAVFLAYRDRDVPVGVYDGGPRVLVDRTCGVEGVSPRR